MRRYACPYFLLTCLAFLPVPAARGEPPVTLIPNHPSAIRPLRTDLYGDPLPSGAVARMGTVRFRKYHGMAKCTFSPDGRLVATTNIRGCEACCAGPCSSFLFLWDRASGRLVRTLGDANSVENQSFMHFLFTPDSRQVISAGQGDGDDYSLQTWDVVTGKQLARWNGKGPWALRLAVSPDGRTLVCLDQEEKMFHFSFWDLTQGRLQKTLACPEGFLAFLDFTVDGTGLILGDAGGSLVRLEKDTGKKFPLLSSWDRSGDPLSHFALARDSLTLVGCDSAKTLCVWNLATGRKRRLVERLPTPVSSLTLSANGQTLLLGDEEGKLELWDLGKGKLLRRVTFDDRWWYDPALSPDGTTLAFSDSSRHELQLRDVATGRRLLDSQGTREATEHLAYSFDGKSLHSWSASDGLTCWQADSGKCLLRAPLPPDDPDPASVFRFSPGGTWAAQAQGSTIHIYDPMTGKRIRSLLGHRRKVTSLAFSARGSTLASGSMDGTVRVWDASTGKIVKVLQTGRFSKKGATILLSPDGGTVAATGRTGIGLWSVATGHRSGLLRAPRDIAVALIPNLSDQCCFSPDGQTLYHGSGRSSLTWDLGSRTEKCNYQQPETAFQWDESSESTALENWLDPSDLPLGSPVPSPDGRLLARFDVLHRLEIWEIASGNRIFRFPDYNSSVAFSPNGRHLAAGCVEDCSILVWDLWELFRMGSGDAEVRGLTGNEPAWKALASATPGIAFRAMAQLAADKAVAIRIMEQHLHPITRPDPDHVSTWLKDLDHESFAVREQALRKLRDLRDAGLQFLKQARTGPLSPEARSRVDSLLDLLEPRSGESLREVRAVQLLEHLVSPAARDLLSRLAQGYPEARLTREAKASLECLARRPDAAR